MKARINRKTVPLIFAALFTAVIAAVSQISSLLPTGIPVTFQVFTVALCGFVLGVKWGTASVAAYIILGAVGLPIYSFLKGGVHNLFGVTGGFILGFIILALFCGMARNKKISIKILFGIIGLLICHIWGTVQFSFVTKTGIVESFIMASLPYIIKDIILVIASVFLSKYFEKYIKMI